MEQTKLLQKRRGRKPTSKNYFEEKEMILKLSEYKKTKNPILYNELYSGFNKIIKGMINTHYSYNSSIVNMNNENGILVKNYDEAISECMYNIFKSLRLYDPEKGKLYSYINRIIKNTLTCMTNKKRKINSNEINYSTIYNNDINEDYNTTSEENIDNIHHLQQNNIDESGFISEDNLTQISPLSKNTVINVKSSMYIIYKYISYVYSCVHYFVDNQIDKENLIDNIKYDTSANFEFYDTPIIDKNFVYNDIISRLDIALNNIKTWLEENYPEEIKIEPEDYEGMISNRALGYIRKINKNMLKKQKTLDLYNINELTNFIQYLIIKKEENYG